MTASRITRIEAGTLVGRRPRIAGSNSRLSIHGQEVPVPLLRFSTEDGASGFGPVNHNALRVAGVLGAPLDALITVERGVAGAALALEYPLWDLLGQVTGEPVYRLVAQQAGKAAAAGPLRVPCYDTTLLIDDLHLEDDAGAAALIAEEAFFGYANNHRAFKIKVGRGAFHMPLEQGTQRDIAVVRAVREAVGPDARLMIDANNGYNQNIAKRVLAETADCQLFWLEEAFQEDPVLYEDLHKWMEREGLAVLIADGESWAPRELMDWARQGHVDVIQYDIFSHGFSNWLRTGAQLDAWDVRSAPHHYGRHLGNYVSGHLAAAIDGYAFAEWDEVRTPGLDASAYRVEEGEVVIPDSPGFGLALDEEAFRAAVAQGGYELTLRDHGHALRQILPGAWYA
ncbi:MAG: hypothetical protein OXF63_03650 [Anaerolineaceae bacterium]|nr:hypothetical protein [Anaerolineaceae bacterium]